MAVVRIDSAQEEGGGGGGGKKGTKKKKKKDKLSKRRERIKGERNGTVLEFVPRSFQARVVRVSFYAEPGGQGEP